MTSKKIFSNLSEIDNFQFVELKVRTKWAKYRSRF